MNALPSAPSRLPLLLLLLLAPGVGLAAPESALVPRPRHSALSEPLRVSSSLPGTDARAPLRLREDGQARQENAGPPALLRILAETGAGLLTSLGGGLGGALVGSWLCEENHIPRGTGVIPCLEPAAVGLLLGAGAAFALGVWWGGEVVGGDGRLLGALIGFGTFAAAGFLIGTAQGNTPAGLFVALPFSMIGAIVGYELSQRQPTPGPRAPAVASSPARLQPVLAFSPRGTVVGLGGTF